MIGPRSDSSKVLLGCPRKGPEMVESYLFETAVIAPGVAVCMNSDGEVEAGADTPPIGISRGISMNHKDRNSVTLGGNEVPLKLTDLSAFAVGTVEIEDYAELISDGFDKITVGTVEFVAQAGAAAPGSATFQAASSDEATATSLAAQINAHDDTKDLVEAEADGAIVTITAKEKGLAGNEITLAYTDEGDDDAATVSGEALEGGYNAYDYVVEGGPVFVDDVTGLATEEDSGTTEVNWKYASGVLEGVSPQPGGESAPCALVNMVS